MSVTSGVQMGTENRSSVLPVSSASGPGFLGPSYNPADEMLPPASIGVRRGGELGDVMGAVKGVVYYGDMMGFGQASSAMTQGMPGLKPLGVNYFVNSGLMCSNGATMWEYVSTIPQGTALGNKLRDAIANVGLPQMRGMAPGIVEDAKYALNPSPIINAVVGSGYPQCELVTKPVGDFDGKIYNVDGELLVDPNGLIDNGGGRYSQQRWVQKYKPVQRRPGESDASMQSRADPIQLPYELWDKEPKIYRENGCLKPVCVPAADGTPAPTDGSCLQEKPAGAVQPNFCGATDGFAQYQLTKKPTALVSLSVGIIAILAMIRILANN